MDVGDAFAARQGQGPYGIPSIVAVRPGEFGAEEDEASGEQGEDDGPAGGGGHGRTCLVLSS